MENYSDEGSHEIGNKDVSLQELKDKLAEFARVRGWDQYHSPRNLLLALVSHHHLLYISLHFFPIYSIYLSYSIYIYYYCITY